MRLHCPQDTGFEMLSLTPVSDEARDLFLTEALHCAEYLGVSREDTFRFFETLIPEQRINMRATA